MGGWYHLVWLCVLVEGHLDPVRDQIVLYKERHEGTKPILTTSNGAPVETQDTSGLNKRLLYDAYFMDTITHLNRQVIPELLVHSKGTGAFGYFEVTNNVTEYTKADFLSKIGKKTPVAVRFSPGAVERGGSDSTRGLHGFAVKLYTRQGNFDLVCLNTPIFVFKNPVLFPSFTHAQRKNPSTHVLDANMQWDFQTRHPETFNMFMQLLGNVGLPKGYRHMSGYAIHTYQIQNKFGKIYFARFVFTPDIGRASLTSEEGAKLDPNAFIRDLYEAIACGKRVSWTLNMQLMTVEQAFNSDIDVFDTTLELPFEDFPLTPVGKLVLNRNPENQFAEIEQLAFCPCNLVPGIDGGPDKLFEARAFAYRDAHLYRLGVNFNRIKVNCPFVAHTYNRDGVAPVGDNGGDSPNYSENSFNGPIAYTDINRTALIKIHEKEPDNFKQAGQLYLKLSEEEKKQLVDNIVTSLGPAIHLLQKRAVDIYNEIEPDLGNRVKQGLEGFSKEPVCNIPFDQKSSDEDN